jgi:hypothetical protein
MRSTDHGAFPGGRRSDAGAPAGEGAAQTAIENLINRYGHV